jgi:hypothetical protein
MLPTPTRTAIRLLLYAYLAGIIAYIFLSYWGPETWPDSRLPDMISGTAPQPYVTRRLVPDLLAWIAGYWPPAWDQWLHQSYHQGGFFPYYHAAEHYIGIYLIYCVLVWLCLFGHAVGMRLLAIQIYPDRPAILAEIAPLLSLVLLPICFRYYDYCYDATTILLATIGPLFLLRRQWLYFSLTFLAACLNKETAVLLDLFFLATTWNVLPRGKVIAAALVQGVVWAVIRGAIAYRFRYTPVHPQFHLFEHNLVLYQYPQFLYFVAAIVILGLVAAHDWRKKPRVLRIGLLINLVPLAAAGLFMGFIDELRDYYEAWPFVVLLMLPTIGAAMQAPPKEVGDGADAVS